jgi:hypothetical protein
VKVGARARACAAGGPDPLSGVYRLADAHAPAGQVRVERGEASAERDLDYVPVALVPTLLADGDHSTGLGGPHRERTEDADVDARMPTAPVVAEG